MWKPLQEKEEEKKRSNCNGASSQHLVLLHTVTAWAADRSTAAAVVEKEAAAVVEKEAAAVVVKW